MIGILLKEQTKELHDLVEEKLMSHKIMDRSFTLAEYTALLQHNYRFLLHFEETVFKYFSATTGEKLHLEKRRKLPLIKKDLTSLRINTSIPETSVDIKNEAEALGILYVMEGATLGGNIIAKNLAKNPHFENITLNYFGAYGAETGFLWKNFQQLLSEKENEYPAEDFLDGAKKAYHFLLDN